MMRQIKVLQRPLRDAVGFAGLICGGLPIWPRRLAEEVLSKPKNALRITGLVAIAKGVGIVRPVRG